MTSYREDPLYPRLARAVDGLLKSGKVVATGDPKVEEAYATHFVWPGKHPFHAPNEESPT